MKELAALADGVVRGKRRAVAKAITLLESQRAEDRLAAEALLEALAPFAGKSMRLGISGVPGVGKSTLIEALGLLWIARGRRVAVLAVDPSSQKSKGSILGDKTRMQRLAQCEAAFIRPSPSGMQLGGVAERTHEAITILEAAGYDVVIVETVGVGQNEVAVAQITDLLVLVQLPNAGDELQGMKKGIMEWVDVVLINKSDTDPQGAVRAAAQIEAALALMHRGDVAVLMISAQKGDGLEKALEAIESTWQSLARSGALAARRAEQAAALLKASLEAELLGWFYRHPRVGALWPELQQAVQRGELIPALAARRLLSAIGVGTE